MTVTLTDEERDVLVKLVAGATGPFAAPDSLRAVRLVQGLLRKLQPKPVKAPKKKGK